MTYQTDYEYQEETLLSPHETEIRFEAKVLNADYLLEPNRFGGYVVELAPLTMSDHQLLFEVGEKAQMLVEMRKSAYSHKVAKPQYETPSGFVIASQLFAPVLNIDVERNHYLHMRDASIAGHYRDLSNGNVVLNLDFIDFYEQETRTSFEIDEAENPGDCSEIDW